MSSTLGDERDEITGYALIGYAPANFQDAEDSRPLEIALDPTGQASQTPYTNLVENVLDRQIVEVRDRTSSPHVVTANWKKRIREFMVTKNEELVKSLKRPIPPNLPLAKAEVFLQKFGRPDFSPTHPSFQGILLDGSGVSGLAQLEKELMNVGPSNPAQIIAQVKYLFDAYREAGDDVLRQENALRKRLDILDKVYQKVIGFCDLPVNEDSEKLAESIEVYLKKVTDENRLEEQYNYTVEAYRRFVACKELLSIFRFADLQDKEPLCMICLEETVAFALNPCGHTFCGNCGRKQLSSCYMCRAPIKDRIKIYFG